MVLAGGCALAACAATTSTAQAGTISISEPVVNQLWIDYQALIGERNDVSATYDRATRTFVMTDAGATVLLPGNAAVLQWCRFARRRVTCVLPQLYDWGETNVRLYLWLDDGDDASSTNLDANVGGGAGDDRLTSVGPASATFDGGEGADVLTGGAGDDRFDGGEGADHLDAGEGHDTLEWYGGVGGIHVSLDGVANDGHDEGAEGDNALDFEVVNGTDDADVIEGGPADETFYAWGGDDTIVGGPGRDRFFGHDGDDRLDMRDGEADGYFCGNGIDEVLADSLDSADGGRWPACETITVEG